MVVCPGCGSSRIRDDYRPAPLILRVIGIKALFGVFDAVEKAPVLSSFECPDCGSGDTRRRSRSSIDRAVFSMTEHRAYSCNSCGASFYAKADSEMGEGRVANSSGAV
ncbi:MAG: hypothetical protein IPJ07_08540 [Acidobacteria bacterium]|nr:hypothetical protein [Acidobacteriota bacterium]